MSARGKLCPACHSEMVWAVAPNGGRMMLQPYPEQGGRYRTVVRAGRVVVLDRYESPYRREVVKRYEPHAPHCVTPRKAVPRVRPEQTALPIGDA